MRETLVMTLYSVVCVFFPFILDIKFVERTSRGHTGGRSHRISHPPSFCGACLNFSREKDSAIPSSTVKSNFTVRNVYFPLLYPYNIICVGGLRYFSVLRMSTVAGGSVGNLETF